MKKKYWLLISQNVPTENGSIYYMHRRERFYAFSDQEMEVTVRNRKVWEETHNPTHPITQIGFCQMTEHESAYYQFGFSFADAIK